MRILLIGAAGRLGVAVHKTLEQGGHEVITVGRGSGELRYDITDPAQIRALYERTRAGGPLDAVASAAGEVPFKPVAELTPEDHTAAFRGKVLSQLELVRQGIHDVGTVAERGSFTLISGVLTRSPIRTGGAAAMANGAVEAFVRSAAVEIAPQRINAVSPTVFTEALDDYDAFFPGMPSVDVADVAQAYVRSIEGAQTGQVYELGH